MTPTMTPKLTLTAMALVFALGMTPAMAEDAAPAAKDAVIEATENAPAGVKERMKRPEGKEWRKHGEHKGPPHKGKGGRGFGHISEEELTKLEGMDAKQRRAYMEEKRKAWEAMSEEERKAAREKKKAEYEALSDEKKAEIKERHKKLTEKVRAEHKAEFEAMSPEEQAAFKEKMRKRIEERGGKWGEPMKEGGFKKPAKPADAPAKAPAE